MDEIGFSKKEFSRFVIHNHQPFLVDNKGIINTEERQIMQEIIIYINYFSPFISLYPSNFGKIVYGDFLAALVSRVAKASVTSVRGLLMIFVLFLYGL